MYTLSEHHVINLEPHVLVVENYSVVTKEKLQYSTTEIRSCLCKLLLFEPIRNEFSTLVMYSTLRPTIVSRYCLYLLTQTLISCCVAMIIDKREFCYRLPIIAYL